jgi:hypothetical protein
MTGEIQRMIRGAIGGAALGGGIGGTALGLIGTVMVGLEPIVFIVCGVYAGVVYGGIAGALHGARERVDLELAAAQRPQRELAPAYARSSAA